MHCRIDRENLAIPPFSRDASDCLARAHRALARFLKNGCRDIVGSSGRARPRVRRRHCSQGSCEKDRSDHQALQARRGEGSAARSRRVRHHRDRSQGLRPPEGPHRTLSRRRIRRRFPAQGEAGGGRARRPGRTRGRSDRRRGPDRAHRRRQDLRLAPSKPRCASAPARGTTPRSETVPGAAHLASRQTPTNKINAPRKDDNGQCKGHPEADQGRGDRVGRSSLHRSQGQVAAPDDGAPASSARTSSKTA